MLVIINYGMGNLGSVQKAFERLNIISKISDNLDDIKRASKLILPGVGHFEKGITNLFSNNLIDLLSELIHTKKTPILGICLGMQLMTHFSEEGNLSGLSWIEAKTLRFSPSVTNKIKIPHMGWNNLHIKKDNPLFKSISENDLFYFVHSYYISCMNKTDILATTSYGKEFVSVFNKENIWGCQFHPEKSHRSGLQLLKNFSEL